MHIWVGVFFFVRFCIIIFGLWTYGAGGFMDKWKMMSWAHEHEKEKGLSFSLKSIAIPIPIPIPIAIKEKGDSHPMKKPWKAESKDMFWKMMMMKMVMDKGKGDKGKCCPAMQMAGWPPMMKGGDKKASKGSPMCCAQMQMAGWPPMKKGGSKKASKGSSMCCPQMQMNGGWPMMKSKKGSSPMMCCPQMMMNGCMMNGGWPAPMSMGCQSGGGGGWWPEEEEDEEEEEEYPDYEEEELMSGWDTVNILVLKRPDQAFIEKLRRKGDYMTQSRSKAGYDQGRIYSKANKLRTIFRKGARNFKKSFENDFD